MSEGTTVSVATLKEINEAFNAHDLDAIMRFFAEECVLDMPHGQGPGGARYQGKSEVRRGLATRFEGLPDAHYGEDRHWVVGDFGVSEWTLTGTQRSGERLVVRGCDHFEFSGGKIAVKNSYWKIIEEPSV